MGAPLVKEPGDDVFECSHCQGTRGRQTILATGRLAAGSRLHVKCPRCHKVDTFRAPMPGPVAQANAQNPEAASAA